MRIDDLRKMIDRLDIEILRLMNQRAEKAVEIGKIKSAENLGFHAPGREIEIIRNLQGKNSGPLDDESVKNIFREIMSACLSLQKPPSAAYFGPEATFTHLAAMEMFGAAARYAPVKTIGDVFREVEKGRCDYGVVPVENSIEGMVSYTLDMFIDSDLKICGEVLLAINHHLLSNSPLEKIEVVYSHPQAFAQCRTWLEQNMPGRKLTEVASTAEAARLARSEENSAAIAGMAASKMYGLAAAAFNVEDSSTNMTRFLVVAKTAAGKTGNDKTSVMFSIKDRVGALYDMLKSFKEHGINLTKIESRPSKKKAWDYFFFLDMKGHVEDERVNAALGELEKECVFFKLLGSYPEAEKK